MLGDRSVSKLALIIFAGCTCLLISMSWGINHYRDNAITYKGQRDKASEQVVLANTTIKDMQTRQRDTTALDAKYSGELADAKETIDRLHSDVIAGRKRLQLSATCKNNSTETSGMDDAPTAELTQDARRNYFRLRKQIEISDKQIVGLQEYVRQQCFN